MICRSLGQENYHYSVGLSENDMTEIDAEKAMKVRGDSVMKVEYSFQLISQTRISELLFLNSHFGAGFDPLEFGCSMIQWIIEAVRYVQVSYRVQTNAKLDFQPSCLSHSVWFGTDPYASPAIHGYKVVFILPRF